MTFPTLNLTRDPAADHPGGGGAAPAAGDLLIANKRVLGWLSLVAVLGALRRDAVSCRPASPDFQGMALADGLGLVRQPRPS